MTAVPQQYLVTHHLLIEEFQNTSHWPKHLLLDYKWAHSETVQADAGLYVVFAAGGYIISAMQRPVVANINPAIIEIIWADGGSQK